MTTGQQVRYSSNSEIAGELLDLKDKNVVDVGCGEGRFTRFLANSARETTGIDINQESLDRAAVKAQEENAQVNWRNARAEDMPFDDESLDIVIFSNSLHHVAPDQMDSAIREADRVLKPGGDLYVMEPVAAGDYFEATRMVSDESVVRDAARQAIDNASSAGFTAIKEIAYHARRSFNSFEEFEDEQSRRGEKRRKIFEEHGAEVRETFVNAARKEDGKLCFDQIFRVNLLRKDT